MFPLSRRIVTSQALFILSLYDKKSNADSTVGKLSVCFNSHSTTEIFCKNRVRPILGDPGAASRDDGIFMGESLQQERESPWALTVTDPVPEAFEFSPSDWHSCTTV